MNPQRGIIGHSAPKPSVLMGQARRFGKSPTAKTPRAAAMMARMKRPPTTTKEKAY